MDRDSSAWTTEGTVVLGKACHSVFRISLKPLNVFPKERREWNRETLWPNRRAAEKKGGKRRISLI